MPVLTKQLGRPSVQRKALLEHLRGGIVRGAFAPGSRLPRRAELQQKFSMSKETVQQAFNRLRTDGFVEVRHRDGTFVVPRPPHLHRYGLVFPHRHSDTQPWSRYLTALAKEASALESDSQRQLPRFYDATSLGDLGGNYAELLDSVLNHRVAGLIFLTQPSHLFDTPVVNEHGIPRAAIMHPDAYFPQPIRAVYPDWLSFYRKALRHLHDQGCRKVALLTHGNDTGTFESFARETAEMGMTTAKKWMQLAHGGNAYNIASLLMQGNSEHRPDGLILADDNLVEDAARGLLESNIRVDEDLHVVAHCNWPDRPPCPIPATWLGFSAKLLLRHCVESIDRQRRGHHDLPPILLPAMFQEELKNHATDGAERRPAALEGQPASPI